MVSLDLHGSFAGGGDVIHAVFVLSQEEFLCQSERFRVGIETLEDAVVDLQGVHNAAIAPLLEAEEGENLINQIFAFLCLQQGCDGGIVDPLQINDRIFQGLDTHSESFRLAKELLLGQDEYGMNYIAAAREGTV